MPTNLAQLSPAQAIDWCIGAAERHLTDNCKWALLNVPTGSSGAEFNGTQATLATGQTWQTGTRVRVSQINSFATGLAPLALNTDYWVVRTSATVFGLASSRSNALAGTTITLPTITNDTDFGLAAAAPDPTWPLAEIVAYELSHALYTTRYSLPNTLPTPIVTGNTANLDAELATITSTDPTPIVYNAFAIIKNGSSAISNTSGTLLNARSLASAVTINSGDAPRLISYRFSQQM
jgi:hypothetical protein